MTCPNSMTSFTKKLFTYIIGASVSVIVKYLSKIMAAGITTIDTVLFIVKKIFI